LAILRGTGIEERGEGKVSFDSRNRCGDEGEGTPRWGGELGEVNLGRETLGKGSCRVSAAQKRWVNGTWESGVNFRPSLVQSRSGKSLKVIWGERTRDRRKRNIREGDGIFERREAGQTRVGSRRSLLFVRGVRLERQGLRKREKGFTKASSGALTRGTGGMGTIRVGVVLH